MGRDLKAGEGLTVSQSPMGAQEDNWPFSKKAPVVEQASPTRELTEMDLNRAELYYLGHREEIETKHWDQYIAVDVDDGRHVLGTTRLGAASAFRAQHGSDRYCCTFHIGTTR